MISIIVPLYKGKKYIVQILDNVHKLVSYPGYRVLEEPVELIFVNDTPEETLDIITDNAFDVVIIYHRTNMGIHQARVTGLNAAKGDYVMFMDQDDYVSEDFLFSQLKSIHNSDVVVSNGYKDYGNYKVRLYKNKLAKILLSRKKSYIYGTDMIFSPGQCLIRRDSIPLEWKKLILQNNGCDDFFLWLLMFGKNCRVAVNFDTFYYHQETGLNYSNSQKKMTVSFAEMNQKLCTIPYINKKDIAILEKRVKIKEFKEQSKLKLIKILISNPLICINTLLYKLSGYH